MNSINMNSIYNIYQHHYSNQINYFPSQTCAIFAQIQSLYPNVLILRDGIASKEIINEITKNICDLATHWLKLADTAVINLHFINIQQLKLASIGTLNIDNLGIKNAGLNYSNAIKKSIFSAPDINHDFTKLNLIKPPENSNYSLDFNDISKNSEDNDQVIIIQNSDVLGEDNINSGTKKNILDLTLENKTIDLTIDFEAKKTNSCEANNNIENDTLHLLEIPKTDFSSKHEIQNNRFSKLVSNNLKKEYDHEFTNECSNNTNFNMNNNDTTHQLNDSIINSEQSENIFTDLSLKCKLDTYNNINIVESKEVDVCIKKDNEIIIDTTNATIFEPDNDNLKQLSLLQIMKSCIFNEDNENDDNRNDGISQLLLGENKSINLFNDTLDSLIKEELAHKDSSLYKKKLFNCLRCRYSTDVLLNYQRHLRAHNGRFICRLCNRAFIKSDDLYRHWSTHKVKASNGYYRCDTCDFTAPSKVSVEEHMRIHYRIKVAKALSEKVCCGICKCLIDRSKQFEHKRIVHGRFFRNETTFDNLKSKHLSNCLSGKLYKCPECCRHIRNARALLRHHFVAHIQPKSSDKGSLVLVGDKSQMKCRFCKLEFVEVEDFDKHEISHVISEFAVTDVTTSLKQEMVDLDGLPSVETSFEN